MSVLSVEKPQLIQLPKLGNPEIGFLSVVEGKSAIPFEIKRVYWTYMTPHEVVRGNHAHRELRQLIVAVSGQISFTTEDLAGEKIEFNLEHPSVGLLIPPWHWRTIEFSDNAVLLCLASEPYEKSDYIFSYEEFLKLRSERL